MLPSSCFLVWYADNFILSSLHVMGAWFFLSLSLSLYNHTFLQMCTQMNSIITLFSSCTTSTNFVERRDGLVVIEKVVEENTHLEFNGNVCFKTEHQLGLQGVDRLFLFTRHGLVKWFWWVFCQYLLCCNIDHFRYWNQPEQILNTSISLYPWSDNTVICTSPKSLLIFSVNQLH